MSRLYILDDQGSARDRGCRHICRGLDTVGDHPVAAGRQAVHPFDDDGALARPPDPGA